MRTTVSARHCTITEDLRVRAERIVSRLAGRTPFGQEATVVFDAESLAHTVEIRFRLSGGEVLVAAGEGTDHRSALDEAERRLRRQLSRPGAKPRRGPSQV
ncbi:MAG: Sigma 54 modulation protein / ribosomal protein [Gemmatimonadetes bacterium]|nr:Sigma 54 modulation protein / ribosomal protein [Gemmatimonadota bacterium]